ncbi:MAG TPA: carboxypeptidase-like regulatory domain-containing protein [Bryobacteraceae bacterium]|nr:carboxypeptidase-like regulatory domain-containing protein [Bryobacteraceae bacterium]
MPNTVTISGLVTHTDASGVIQNAEVYIYPLEPDQTARGNLAGTATTRSTGRFTCTGSFPPGRYVICCNAFGSHEHRFELPGDTGSDVHMDLKLDMRIVLLAYLEGDRLAPTSRAAVGKAVVVRLESGVDDRIDSVTFSAPRGCAIYKLGKREAEIVCARPGPFRVDGLVASTSSQASPPPNGAAKEEAENTKPGEPSVPSSNGGGGGSNSGTPTATVFSDLSASEEAQTVRGQLGITLQRTASDPTLDQALWVAIRNRTQAISFGRYREFINRVLRWEENDKLPEPIERRLRDLGTHLHGVGAYHVLKTATEMFLLLECGVRIEERDGHRPAFDSLEEEARLGGHYSSREMAARLKDYLGHRGQLPYITRVVEAAFPEYDRIGSCCDGLLIHRINEPCLLELIWSYWHEEGMLMQTINAISQRFQNVRRPLDRDPVANMEVDPLRPVNNLLWGYIQDEVNRLTVSRRAYEYAHQYGLTLFGKATAGLQPADSRSKFLEAFHNLLYQSSVFFKEDFQTTVIADGFPLLNALKEVHLILAQGAQNQFGDLPWTARAEMLLAEYIISRPEIRDFLQSRAMVPYREAWMPQVDAMKTLQNWTDVTVTHFRDLGVYGEQLLLSIRYGDWIDVNDEDSAKNWARYWRPEIQGYLHAYRATTGIDLTNPDTVDATVPAILLQKRLTIQQRAR